jgi:negative regulator of flagellin synthesis FlgM
VRCLVCDHATVEEQTMLYRQISTDFAFNESHADFDPEALLMRSQRLRYDRSHGGAAGRESASTADDSSAGEALMDISGPGSVGGPGPIRPSDVRATGEVAPASQGIEIPADEVEFSAAAQMLERLSADPQVREARLQEIQAQIAAGTYETPEKLEAAIMRMLSEVG